MATCISTNLCKEKVKGRKSNSRFKMKSWMKSLWDKDKFEVTLRVGVICLCGFSLSIASIPSVVPPSQSLMPGMMASVFSQSLPTLMFTLGLPIPVVLVLILAVAGWATMLLAAGTVSDGLFIGIYSIFTLFMTTLFFGEHYTSTSGTANVFIAVGGLLGLSYLPLVQEGGLSTVSDMWTEKGTENSAAVWRNLLIAVCWALACMVVGILLPPWRTSRQMISRGLLPAIYKQVDAVLSGVDVDVNRLVKSKTALKGGNVAMTTIFEPRLCHLAIDVVTPLKEIAVATDEMIFRSLLVLKWKERMTVAPSDLEVAVLQDTSTILDLCGKALSTNDAAQYDCLRDCVDDKIFHEKGDVESGDKTGSSKKPEDSIVSWIHEQALEVRTPTLDYLQAFNHGITKDSSKKQMLMLIKQAVGFVSATLMPSVRLMKASSLIFQPKRWDYTSILWSLELSAGFVALMAMTLFVDSYEDFRITPAQGYVGPGKSR